MKILLCAINSKYIHSSLSVWYLYESIKKHSPSSEALVYESTVNAKLSDTLSGILEKNPDIVAFSCYIWNIEYVKKLIHMIEEEKHDIKIILGGPEATFDAKNLFYESPSVKYIIRGEGEAAVPALLNGEIIKGVCFEKDGEFVNSGIADNTEYISPYSQEYFKSLKGRISYLEASRGCPFSCSFCLSGREDKLRLFDLETVKENIIRLAISGTKTVKFVDRTFNCVPKRAKDIISFIISEYKMRIPDGVCFHFEVAADLFDSELISLLNSAPAGLFQIEAGIQSFNERTLAECTRKTNLGKVRENLFKIISKRNVHVHIDLIAGLPYEDIESFEKSFNMAYSLGADMLQLGFLKFLKGSRISEEREKMQAVVNENAPYEIISNMYITEEEIRLLKKIEDLTERMYNSGRFRRTLKYLMKELNLSPFKFFSQSELSYESKIPLNDFFNLVYEAYKTKVDPETLRDVLICDFLSTNASGRLPSSLYLFDKELSKVRAELKGKCGSAMLYSGKRRAVTVCYENPPHPVTGRYRLGFLMQNA